MSWVQETSPLAAPAWTVIRLALAATFLLGSGAAAMLVLVRYLRRAEEANAPTGNAWLNRWAFSPASLSGSPGTRLFLASVAGLFLELLLIRWLSSEIRILAYFKNLVLVASYLGFGLGCYLARRNINLLALTLPVLTLAAIVKLPWTELRQIMARLPAAIGGLSGVDVWGVPSVPLAAASIPLMLAALAAIVPLVVLVALTFVPIGQLVGYYLESAKDGITAYSVNVAGSLAGILLYTGLCFVDQPPAVWFVVAGALLVLLFAPSPRLGWTAAGALALCVGLASLGPGGDSKVYWSPYQKLTLTPWRDGGEIVAYELNTNDTWYQRIVNLSPAFVAAHPRLVRGDSLGWNPYNLPYRYYPGPARVLVLGAGMGNDVAAALRNGAGRVVAVEIDPLILELGRELHFERPYSSGQVAVVLDDARSYVEKSSERFDLILFSLLDSHTTSSHFTNIRIDNYVYTVEALRAAARLLAPTGLLIVKFQVNTPWIAGRLRALLQTVFGRPPVQLEVAGSQTGTGGRMFIAGFGERFERAAAEAARGPNSGAVTATEPATPTTDDWPYFYQHEPGLPASVITVSVVLALLGMTLIRSTVARGSPLHWHFFLLGAGFLLLETHIVSRMALLFGTTWVVNSIVIGGLLGLILAANAVAATWPGLPTAVGYGGILVSCAVGYAVPMEVLLTTSPLPRIVLATGLLCLPVFFAGIIFVRSFAAEGFRSEALGSNLLGALVGGLLESLSLWTGIRSLLLIAALLYAAALSVQVRTKPAEQGLARA